MDPLNPEKARKQLANLVPLHPPPLQTSHATQGKIGGTTFFFPGQGAFVNCISQPPSPAPRNPIPVPQEKKRLTNQDE